MLNSSYMLTKKNSSRPRKKDLVLKYQAKSNGSFAHFSNPNQLQSKDADTPVSIDNMADPKIVSIKIIDSQIESF